MHVQNMISNLHVGNLANMVDKFTDKYKALMKTVREFSTKGQATSNISSNL